MTAVQISELRAHVGETVTVRGWVVTTRSSGKIAFVVLRDGSGTVQGVLSKKEVPEDDLGGVRGAHPGGQRGGDRRGAGGAALAGRVRARGDRPRAARRQPRLSRSPPKSMGRRSSSSIDTCGSGAGGRWRSPGCATRWCRRSGTSSTRRASPWWTRPILTGAIGEEAGNLFATDYFDLGKAYLAQTGQLYVEAAAAALGKVYCFGPTFRAEKSKTRRHLTEFWMVEPEVAFNDSDANMRLQEAFVSYIVARALDRRKEELKELERDTAPLERVQAPFPRISYTDAVAKLNALGSDIKWGDDLGGDDETLLAKEYDRPVFVFNYPQAR